MEKNEINARPVEECLDGYVFDDSTYKSTLVTEYDLVCSRYEKNMMRHMNFP